MKVVKRFKKNSHYHETYYHVDVNNGIWNGQSLVKSKVFNFVDIRSFKNDRLNGIKIQITL